MLCTFSLSSIISLSLHTCHSSRFNQDIPIFQYKSRTFPIPRVKIPGFCFVSKLDKQKGVSFCRMARVFKPTKYVLKINFIIPWIYSLGFILWTPRLSEWSRLASLSCHPELTWCHSSAASEGPSHLSSILPILLRLQQSVPRKSGKCEIWNYNSAELRNNRSLFTFSFPWSNFHQFRFSQSFMKYNFEFIILTGSPPSREIGKKSEILWWVGKSDKGKWNT